MRRSGAALIQVSNLGQHRGLRGLTAITARPWWRTKGASVFPRSHSQPLKGIAHETIAVLALLLAAKSATASASAADIAAGRRLAFERSAACHIVTGSPRNDLIADAPPFLVIGRKYGFDSEAIALNLVGPHAKMNFALSRPEANDVAAYIQSLAR
jgi:mono/diheme cytochrome c family protein